MTGDVQRGSLWKHYKGGLYEVVCLARVESNPDEVVVIYQNTNDKGFWSRPRSEFVGFVDGIVESDNQRRRKRFTRQHR